MTNEEKIKELSYLNCRRISCNGCGNCKDCSHAEIDEMALEVAKWKDDKFFTILACIKFSLEKQGIKGADKFIEDIQKQWEE